MTGSSRNWRPTTVRRFIKSFPTSVCTALVETDAGPGYLKAMGNPEGPHVLACEWVGTQLAKRLGLSTFDFALIAVTPEDEIPFAKGGKPSPGQHSSRAPSRGSSGVRTRPNSTVSSTRETRLVW